MIKYLRSFFDLTSEQREEMLNWVNEIVKKYKLNDVCEMIIFHLCMQYCFDLYSELDLDYFYSNFYSDKETIDKNIERLFKKSIVGYIRNTQERKSIYLRDEIIKKFDENFEEGFSTHSDKNIVDFLEENKDREDFAIIDMNTDKQVSVQEAVDIMIKNSSIQN
ncbi:hypothetical protein [Brachyspira sp.]|uniref:hypothetical protein n=1 Tax=Brachyspira sp. TaxID=1977261 RepID=UPI003D7D8808